METLNPLFSLLIWLLLFHLKGFYSSSDDIVSEEYFPPEVVYAQNDYINTRRFYPHVQVGVHSILVSVKKNTDLTEGRREPDNADSLSDDEFLDKGCELCISRYEVISDRQSSCRDIDCRKTADTVGLESDHSHKIEFTFRAEPKYPFTVYAKVGSNPTNVKFSTVTDYPFLIDYYFFYNDEQERYRAERCKFGVTADKNVSKTSSELAMTADGNPLPNQQTSSRIIGQGCIDEESTDLPLLNEMIMKKKNMNLKINNKGQATVENKNKLEIIGSREAYGYTKADFYHDMDGLFEKKTEEVVAGNNVCLSNQIVRENENKDSTYYRFPFYKSDSIRNKPEWTKSDFSPAVKLKQCDCLKGTLLVNQKLLENERITAYDEFGHKLPSEIPLRMMENQLTKNQVSILVALAVLIIVIVLLPVIFLMYQRFKKSEKIRPKDESAEKILSQESKQGDQLEFPATSQNAASTINSAEPASSMNSAYLANSLKSAELANSSNSLESANITQFTNSMHSFKPDTLDDRISIQKEV